MKCRSLWQTPLATVRTSTSRAMGLAMSTFSIVSSLCGPWKTAAFMRSLLSFARDEVRERALGLGAAHDVLGVVSLVRPLLLETAAEILEEQPLDAHHGLTAVLGDHRAEPHRLGAQLVAGHEVIEQPDAVGLLR